MSREVTRDAVEKLLKAYYPNYRWSVSQPLDRDSFYVFMIPMGLPVGGGLSVMCDHEIAWSAAFWNDPEFRSQYLRQLGADMVLQYHVKQREVDEWKKTEKEEGNQTTT